MVENHRAANKAKEIQIPTEHLSVAWVSPTYISHHTSHITHHTSHITHHTSRITHHASRITHHASRITHHASRITQRTQHAVRITQHTHTLKHLSIASISSVSSSPVLWYSINTNVSSRLHSYTRSGPT